jgi:hypothetical protein
MKPLQFWGSDALEVSPSLETKRVLLTWVSEPKGHAETVIISIDQLPQVIAYLTACLREMQKPQEA